MRSMRPSSVHRRDRPQTVSQRPYRSGMSRHGAAVEDPEHAVEHGAMIGTPPAASLLRKERLDALPAVVGEQAMAIDLLKRKLDVLETGIRPPQRRPSR